MNVIKIENLTFAYKYQPPVLAEINLAFGREDFVCIVGPNGGGKTTLLRLIMGLLRPVKGAITVYDGAPAEQSHLIGYVPQHLYFDIKFPITVYDVVMAARLPSLCFGRFSAQDHAAVLSALEMLDLVALRQQLFSALSGGQKRRVMIARALACAPKILVLDEPTVGIDAVTEQGFLKILKDLSRQMTIVMVSHDPHFVSKLATKVVCINRNAYIHNTSELVDPHTLQMSAEGLRLVFHNDHCHV